MKALRTVSLATLALVTHAGAVAQEPSNRVLSQLAPPIVGGTAVFELSYPSSAVGNLFMVLWCAPQFPGTQPLPGYQIVGQPRVDLANTMTWHSGVLSSAGTSRHQVWVPYSPALVGYSWDLQSVDFSPLPPEIAFSDNDLALQVTALPPSHLHMVPIQPGTFMMGSTAGERWEQSVHPVTISRPFWIGKYEVTQEQYRATMGFNPSRFQGASYPNSGRRPVEQVSWDQAMTFCHWLTFAESALGRVPSGYVYRLPTEAEWEYCCRAGTITEYWVGPTLSCVQALHEGTSWHSQCGISQTAVVGSYPENPFGLHDTHGNVSEWCIDRYEFNQEYPDSHAVDPRGTWGSSASVRGGSWIMNSYYCRSAFRMVWPPTSATGDVGFRVVLAPDILQ